MSSSEQSYWWRSCICWIFNYINTELFCWTDLMNWSRSVVLSSEVLRHPSKCVVGMGASTLLLFSSQLDLIELRFEDVSLWLKSSDSYTQMYQRHHVFFSIIFAVRVLNYQKGPSPCLTWEIKLYAALIIV